MSTRSQSKREAQTFRNVIKNLGYESIGDFIELAGGIVSMLMQDDNPEKENVKVMGEQLVMQTGIIIEQIGHFDKIVERNEELKQAAVDAEANRKKKDKAIAAAEILKSDTKNPTLFGPDGNVL